MTEYATGKGSYVHYRKPTGQTGKIYAWGKSGRTATKTHIKGKGWSYTHTTYVTVSGREARKAPAPSQKPTPVKEEVAPPGEEKVYPYYPKESRYYEIKPTPSEKFLPGTKVKEFTPSQLITTSRYQEETARTEWQKQQEEIDPTAKYEIPVEGQVGVKRIVTGKELLSEMGLSYKQYFAAEKGFRQQLGAYPSSYTLTKTGEGYAVHPGAPMKVHKVIERITGVTPEEQKYVAKMYPTETPYFKEGSPWGGQAQKRYWWEKAHPVHQATMAIGGAVNPFAWVVGERYGAPSGYVSLPMGTAISPLTGADMGKEWRYAQKHLPYSILATGGELLGGWMVAPGVKYVAGKVIAPVLKPVVSPIARGVKHIGVKAFTGMEKGVRYMPKSVQRVTSGLFGKVQPGTFTVGRTTVSTMIDPTTRYTSVVGGGRLRLAGGHISRFIYQSPKSPYFVTGGYAQPLYGAGVIKSRGLFKGISKAGTEPSRGWGMFKGFRVEKFTTMKRYYPWSKGGNIYQPGQWMSAKHIESLQKMGTTIGTADVTISGRGFGLIGTKTTLGKPYGFPKKVDVTQVGYGMQYRNIDKFIPNIMKTMRPVDYSFFGMGKITKPVIAKGGVTITKQLTPSTWKGVSGTQMLRFESPKMVSKAYLRQLDWLEPSYKPTAMPPGTSFPGIIFQPTKTPGRIDVFSGLAGRGLPVWGRGLIGKPKVVMRYERKPGLRLQTGLDKYVYKPITGTGLVPSLITGQLPSQVQLPMLEQATLQAQAYQQMQKQVTVPKVTTALYTGPKPKPFYPLFPKLPKGLYGRGRGMGGIGIDIPEYKFREFKLPSIAKVLKQLKVG